MRFTIRGCFESKITARRREGYREAQRLASVSEVPQEGVEVSVPGGGGSRAGRSRPGAGGEGTSAGEGAAGSADIRGGAQDGRKSPEASRNGTGKSGSVPEKRD